MRRHIVRLAMAATLTLPGQVPLATPASAYQVDCAIVMVTLFLTLFRSGPPFSIFGKAIHEISTWDWDALSRNFTARLSKSPRSAFSPS